MASSVLCSEAKTERKAAEPTAPAFGGKLNSTMATLRSARAVRRRRTMRVTLAASASARSGQACMRGAEPAGVNWQRRPQPWQGAAPSARPPNTVGATAPSSSGIATIMVDSTGDRPADEAPQASMDWNSSG